MLFYSSFSDDFQKLLAEKQSQVQEFLETKLNFPSRELELLKSSMRYSVLAPSKRLRPIVCLLIYEMLEEIEKYTKQEKEEKEREESVMHTACALELIHTYSLIHDDLPALDNDDFRRGQKSNHIVFGEGVAILSGNALLTLAFEWITRSNFSCETVRSITSELSSTVGIQGMIGGQSLDLNTQIDPSSKTSAENSEKKEQLYWIHSHKTAKFLSVCASSGAWMAYSSQSSSQKDEKDLEKDLLEKEKKEKIDHCRRFGFFIGLAFQIVDDILDCEGTEKNLGKRVKKDYSLLKLTYPSLYGIEESKEKAQELIQKAKQELQSFKNTDYLIQLADWILKRQN